MFLEKTTKKTTSKKITSSLELYFKIHKDNL